MYTNDTALNVRHRLMPLVGNVVLSTPLERLGQPPTAKVELFFVKKKSGQLRMVVDCRHSNCWFAPPFEVSLATGDALGRVEIEPHEELSFASADLKDTFYHLSLVPLRQFFWLRPVRSGDVGIGVIDGVKVPWNQLIYPQLAVCPMGWTWALWICQSVHERIVEEAGAVDSNHLTDKKTCAWRWGFPYRVCR